MQLESVLHDIDERCEVGLAEDLSDLQSTSVASLLFLRSSLLAFLALSERSAFSDRSHEQQGRIRGHEDAYRKNNGVAEPTNVANQIKNCNKLSLMFVHHVRQLDIGLKVKSMSVSWHIVHCYLTIVYSEECIVNLRLLEES